MRLPLALLAAIGLWAFAGPTAAGAQSGPDLLARGVRAYEELEFDAAAGLLRRALAFHGRDALAQPEAARALIYLTATELLRARHDSAAAAARRLVLLDPRFQPDELVFPPQVVMLFLAERRATAAVTARAAADTTIRIGTDGFVVRLYASTFHEVTAALTTETGRVVRTLYAGPIADSLDLRWNGLDSAGSRPPDGRYAVTVASLDRARRVVRLLHLPLDVARPSGDTLPHPLPPADSLLRPERRPFGPAWQALAPGALAGAAIALLPGAVARGEDVSGTRLLVGGTVTLAGLVAFLSHHPGRAIPENAVHNRRLQDAWRREVADVTRHNAQRTREVRVTIRAGALVVMTPEHP